MYTRSQHKPAFWSNRRCRNNKSLFSTRPRAEYVFIGFSDETHLTWIIYVNVASTPFNADSQTMWDNNTVRVRFGSHVLSLTVRLRALCEVKIGFTATCVCVFFLFVTTFLDSKCFVWLVNRSEISCRRYFIVVSPFFFIVTKNYQMFQKNNEIWWYPFSTLFIWS